MERLIDQKRMGFSLTEEEQELMKEDQMGGNVLSTNSVMRRIYPPVLTWWETNVKAASGERYPFINCTPKADGPFPTALVLDPEIAQQFDAGMEEYYKVIRRMPVEDELPWEEPYRGRYITHSPLGNLLMSHAVSVIIPIKESLETANDITLEDWNSIMEYYMKRKDLDSKSLFLVATKEFADLAIRLTGTYPFTGLILEEPEEGMFGTHLPSHTEDSMRMIALIEAYEAQLENLKCPTLLFRHRNNPSIPLNDRLLLQPLMDLKRPLFMSITDFPLRSLGSTEDEEAEPNPRFVYDTDSAKKITQRMLYFIQQEGEAPLNLMPEESSEPRSRNRADNIINQFDQMTRRINELTGGAGNSNDLGGANDFGGDDFSIGDDFGESTGFDEP
jgi:hypothetical protein